MATITIQNLTFSYPGSMTPTLRDVNLTIHQGEYIVLCGQSGSGKTTLLRHLKSVLTPQGQRSGHILLDGTDIQQIPLAVQAAKIGFVMQNPNDQIVTDKVWHELAFGLENLGTDPGVMQLRVAEMASYFGIQNWFYRDVAELSGGQKQLLNLAAIMTMQPDILILDEPASQLDPIAAADFLSTLRKINLELGTTVIITEHRLEDIYHCADRVAVMDQGRITVLDTPGNAGRILHQNQSEMFSALPTPVRVFYESDGTGSCPLTVREGRRWLAESLRNSVSTPELHNGKSEDILKRNAALSIKDVWFRYEKNSPDVLRDLTFSVPEGSLYAIVGGNGTGKSTTLKALCGICKPYRGQIRLFGRDIRKLDGSLFHNCMAMLPQDPKSLLVKSSVADELHEMTIDGDFVTQIAELCQIRHLFTKHPHDLSGGEQQRTALAKVLLTRPRILLLDEPTKGLDSFFKVRFAALLENIRQTGVTVVMVSHDVEFCAEYADLVSMFFDGRIVTTDTPRRFFGQNSFYTTAANRMSRGIFINAVTAGDVTELYRANTEEKI